MNSETDFVARGETFTNLAKSVVQCAMGTVRAAKGLPVEMDLDLLKTAVILSSKQTINEAITESIGKLGKTVL
jgi:translation elongation factor EF-Ts